ncbi:MAG: phosphoglycerate kinase [Microgenomates group bacterium]|nr:phosphoglycerate kinase [Microgenomates group bacterium]
MKKIKYIDEVDIKNKKILLRVDFNVSLNPDSTIADDARIRQSLPTIKYLLKNNNRLILVCHLDRPKCRDPRYSVKIVAKKLQEYLPEFKVKVIDDLLNDNDKKRINQQEENEILFLENIRFYRQEKDNNYQFAQTLASLADFYVNDAFGVSHRNDASVTGVPQFMPSYGGLLLKKEIGTILKIIKNPKKPVVVILGGAKVSTKTDLINRLMEMGDYLLVGGAMANTFLAAQGFNLGKSFYEKEALEEAKKILFKAAQKNTVIVLPSDAVIGNPQEEQNGNNIFKIDNLPPNANILDIGPETQAKFGAIIAKAKTIIWNGPVGYFENPLFRRGTDFIYYAITQNQQAISLVGGGDTLAAISKKEYLDKITHVSTGGGAMLEFIEKGTLPGIEALKQ